VRLRKNRCSASPKQRTTLKRSGVCSGVDAVLLMCVWVLWWAGAAAGARQPGPGGELLAASRH
jgi:hypothetical protein